MPENVYLVFSKPPEEISLAEFGDWYEQHVRDILTVDGFVAARRFNFTGVNGDTSPTMYPHLALYVIDGDPHAAMERLAAATASGAVPLPEWFPRGRWASFYGHPLEGAIDLDALEHAYVVFSRPPAGMDVEEYFDWYGIHARENCTAEGFEQAWRYRLERDTVDPLAPNESLHAAIYEVHGELPALRAALKEAAAAGRVGFPDFFGDILFASGDAPSASATVVGASA